MLYSVGGESETSVTRFNWVAGVVSWQVFKGQAWQICEGVERNIWPVDPVWNVMAHAQKPDFVFRRNGRVHLNRRGRQCSGQLAVEVCASAVVMLDTACSEVVWRVLATHSIRQFPLHFPSRASPCDITFQLESNWLTQHTVHRNM